MWCRSFQIATLVKRYRITADYFKCVLKTNGGKELKGEAVRRPRLFVSQHLILKQDTIKLSQSPFQCAYIKLALVLLSVASSQMLRIAKSTKH